MTGPQAAWPARIELPLQDVRSGVSGQGAFLKDTSQLEGFLHALGPESAPDRDWRDSVCYPRPYVAALQDVLVLPGSRLLFVGGIARSDELEMAHRVFALRPKSWDMELLPGPVLRFPPAPIAGEEIEAGVHLTGEHEANYFHWIGEVLPRLHLYESTATERDLPLLVSEGLHPNLYDLLDRVRAPGRPVLRLARERCHRVRRLVYPSDVSRVLDVYDRAPGLDTVYLPVALIADMAGAIRRTMESPAGGGPRRLFVRRSSTYRSLLNEPEIESLLAGEGFTSVEPGGLSVTEQVRLFADAEIVVGASGAAMANLLWCRAGAQVLVLHSDHPFKKYPYWDALARASGVRIGYLAGPRAHNVEGLFEAHDDFSIGPEELTAHIARLTGHAALPAGGAAAALQPL
jgi:hypothetical protein